MSLGTEVGLSPGHIVLDGDPAPNFCSCCGRDGKHMGPVGQELVKGICKRITTVTEDTRETMFLFQRLSIALQKGNSIAFQSTFIETE